MYGTTIKRDIATLSHSFEEDTSTRQHMQFFVRGDRYSLLGLVESDLHLFGVDDGGISGFYGGAIDTIIQRVVEFLISVPTIPLWMGLSAAVPTGWNPVKTYFAITLILALSSWPGLALIADVSRALTQEGVAAGPRSGRMRAGQGRGVGETPCATALVRVSS